MAASECSGQSKHAGGVEEGGGGGVEDLEEEEKEATEDNSATELKTTPFFLEATP